MKTLKCFCLAFAVGVLPVRAADGDRPNATKSSCATPEELTRANWDAVIAVLRNEELSTQAKEAAVEKIAERLIDFPLMAKLALGRANWRRLSAPQRARYLDVFVARLKSSYRKRITAYRGQQVRYAPRPVGPTPSDSRTSPKRRRTGKGRSRRTVLVPIELVSRDRTVAIVHKFRKAGKTWKIYDIEIEGVSILLTYRSQFNDILRTGTPEDLLARLEKPQTD